jgi:hypothetical protein
MSEFSEGRTPEFIQNLQHSRKKSIDGAENHVLEAKKLDLLASKMHPLIWLQW